MFPETEGFILAIQDQVIKTNWYSKHIICEPINEKCRLCGKVNEPIQHISSGCSMLCQNEYLARHNSVAKIIHQELALQYEVLEYQKPYYKYKPESVIDTEKIKLLWDFPISTDRSVTANRSDITVWDKEKKP
jgi:hypothetical protein